MASAIESDGKLFVCVEKERESEERTDSVVPICSNYKKAGKEYCFFTSC